jgi:hypothetical protein
MRWAADAELGAVADTATTGGDLVPTLTIA